MNYYAIPTNDIERVLEVDKYDNSTHLQEEDLDFLSEMAAEICGTKSAMVSLIGKDTQWIKSTHGIDLETREFPREFTFCTHTINDPKGALVVEDARQDPRFAENPFVTGENPVIFYSGVPLINKNGFPLGTICAVDTKPHSLSDRQIEKLQKLANQVMKSLELKRKSDEMLKLNDYLIQEKRKYEYITEGTETATFDWNLKKDILKFNRVWDDISGYEPGEFKGKGIEFWKSLVHPDDIGPLLQNLEDHFKGVADKFENEFRFKHKDGSWIWISSKGKVFSRSKKGNPIRMYGLHRDITAKRQKEDEILYREKLLETLYSLSPIGIALNDFETGAFLEANQKLVEPTGYSMKEFSKVTYQDLTPEEYMENDKEQLGKLETQGFYGPFEKEYLRKDGSRYPVLLNGILAEDAHGKKVIWSFIEDISERKNEEELKEENLRKIQKLLSITESQNDRLKNFAHIVSHNLRSHSSGISLLLTFLQESDVKLNDQESFRHLLNASSNLESTIKDLNEVVEVNLSDSENFHLINLKSVVQKILESTHALLGKNKVQTEVQISEDIEVYGLKAYLESIILNFVTNGIKYSSPERDSYIHLKARKDTIEKRIILEISDNGLGIDLELHRDKLFKMYKTFHVHEDSRGIGLFLTKNQIEAMDGSIEVESAVNEGTTFTIKLPYEEN